MPPIRPRPDVTQAAARRAREGSASARLAAPLLPCSLPGQKGCAGAPFSCSLPEGAPLPPGAGGMGPAVRQALAGRGGAAGRRWGGGEFSPHASPCLPPRDDQRLIRNGEAGDAPGGRPEPAGNRDVREPAGPPSPHPIPAREAVREARGSEGVFPHRLPARLPRADLRKGGQGPQGPASLTSPGTAGNAAAVRPALPPSLARVGRSGQWPARPPPRFSRAQQARTEALTGRPLQPTTGT